MHNSTIKEQDINHIGKKLWSRLSRRQRNAIIRDRKNARKHVNSFINDKIKSQKKS